MKPLDLTNKKFGRLTVIQRAPNVIVGGSSRTAWLCKCECGNDFITLTEYLTQNRTTSCGCKYSEYLSDRNHKTNKFEFIDETTMRGYTNKGEEFIFDAQDYDLIKNFCWRIAGGYVLTSPRHHTHMFLHRLITNCPDDKIVDHINHNPQDNRRKNLRICNYAENSHNAQIGKNNKTGVIGVFYNSTLQKWEARITINRNQIRLGNFSAKEEAIIARLKAEQKYFGEFAPQKELFDKYINNAGG